ncbi:MAG: (Fe-S)-binding protein [Deltaproteobacteria bacterium]|nr:(Fe-S)-binding protein [Deltaproteobacteria bacterium]MBW2066032.1 (Fe-S)-binding protein [Deltaproteobacteria bacterium]
MANRDYSVRQLLELGACTGCQLCAEVCPAVTASGRGELSGVYRIKGLREVVKKRGSLAGKILGRRGPTGGELKPFSETVFRCTLCGNCEEICPVGIRLKNLWISLRQDMVHSEAYPGKIEMIRDNLQGSRNVFAEDNEERAEWTEDMRYRPRKELIKDKAQITYFTGCVAAYFPMAQKIPMALAEIMDTGGIDFTLLGEEEWCCGFPLLGAGLKETAREFIGHNMEAVRRKGSRRIVFACPTCYQMWREYYPREFQLTHATQFLFELIRGKFIALKTLPLKVTYHDPCDLGRGARVFEDPRKVIRAIPGVRLVELARNRENTRCCGGGGNLEMIDPKLSTEISKRKIQEVLETGAQAVVTSCQQCVRTMTTYVKRNKVPLEVMDITQLVLRALRR